MDTGLLRTALGASPVEAGSTRSASPPAPTRSGRKVPIGAGPYEAHGQSARAIGDRRCAPARALPPVARRLADPLRQRAATGPPVRAMRRRSSRPTPLHVSLPRLGRPPDAP